MASSTEDIQNQFKSLNKWFNNLMSPKNYCFKDGNILTILKKMLKMINEDNYKIQVESIINTHLLLTNLHKALSGFEQFRVISMENVRELYDPYSYQLCLSFIPAEGETSLQIFKDEITVMSCSETFRDAQRILWPKVTFAEFIHLLLIPIYIIKFKQISCMLDHISATSRLKQAMIQMKIQVMNRDWFFTLVEKNKILGFHSIRHFFTNTGEMIMTLMPPMICVGIAYTK